MKMVLSISGGGIRGVIPAMVLAELEKRAGLPISSCFNLIAGTSTGGIIACLLAMTDEQGRAKYTAQEVVRLYKSFGKTIFKRSLMRKFATLDGLIGTKYSSKPLEALLSKYFGVTKLSCAKTGLLIPAYQISGKPYPHFFKTEYALAEKSEVDNPCLWKCARSTSAANGYFKPFKLNRTHTFLDGGVFANNPAMCAYVQAKNSFADSENLSVISIGTGEDLIGYSYKEIRNWGMVQWALPFFRQTSISSDATVDYMLRSLCKNGDSYYRLQVSLEKENLKMDDVSEKNIASLEHAAKELIKQNTAALDDIAKMMKACVGKAV